MKQLENKYLSHYRAGSFRAAAEFAAAPVADLPEDQLLFFNNCMKLIGVTVNNC